MQVSPALRGGLGGGPLCMADIFALRGRVYREPEGAHRRTLRFERGGRGYFLKLHWGAGWREILKNLLALRAPVLGAGNEWRAIRRLGQIGVATMPLEAYGQEGWNPARLRSFVITRELEDCVSLEDYCALWSQSPPGPRVKWALLERVAWVAKTLHENGVNHRDFYLCHFLLKEPGRGNPAYACLYLIDLHRVQLRRRTPHRWRVKDIGSLYFSAMDIGLTRRDLLRFIRFYQGPLREALQRNRSFWEDVASRAHALYATKPERQWFPNRRHPLSLAEDGGEFHWLRSLRRIPGKRLVAWGQWQGRPVVAKIYQDRKRGRVHWQRELAGLRALEQAAIPAPRILHAGTARVEGWPLIMLSAIEPGLSFSSAWDGLWDEDNRRRWLSRLVELIARHHSAGILQTDLHLDNFLVSGEELYTLDGAGIRANERAIPLAPSLENLALLVAQLPPACDVWLPDLDALYRRARGWPAPPEVSRLDRRVRHARDHRRDDYLRKIFRDCSEFVRVEHPYAVHLVARNQASEPLWDLLSAPDLSFPGEGLALKYGNTCTVWSTDVGGRRLVVKRYNVKNAWHGLKLTLRRGRAFASWRNAHLLGFYGIPTPQPVALAQHRRDRLRPLAYFVTEYLEGPSALAWFQDEAVAWEAKLDMARRIGALFAGLRAQRIAHGDMKATNVLLSRRGPALVDLDAMRRYAGRRLFDRAWDRDMARFLRNWESRPDLYKLFRSEAVLPSLAGPKS